MRRSRSKMSVCAGALLVASAWFVGSPRSEAKPKPESARPVPPPDSGAPRVISFAWRPAQGSGAEYAMPDPADQHRILLLRGVTRGGRYPVVIAFHGQPRRGVAPRDYQFASAVVSVATSLTERGKVGPFVLVLPVFRYAGANWPGFDLVRFRGEVEQRLAAEGVAVNRYYVVGHSAAAGCGGDGMNRAHRIAPAAVGFFDTCLGAGFRSEVLALREAGVPTLIVHSVETAGFRPRQSREYLPTFDFGRAYAPLGLAPSRCPPELPDAPLRAQPYRCAAEPKDLTRAFVIDTGDGEAGHNAVVPVALAFFLREYVAERE